MKFHFLLVYLIFFCFTQASAMQSDHKMIYVYNLDKKRCVSVKFVSDQLGKNYYKIPQGDKAAFAIKKNMENVKIILKSGKIQREDILDQNEDQQFYYLKP